ncbi:hypothetical protein [Actinoplanes auranticolor]|uniref:Uncharacterized protein n=1 Tax=Actinoplanes auranticolor TaxID=47988 RepID=A0A919SM75_9ACTN|nr:hypothetical protein [Actinoplanes auranticolor]GIM73248.1 hypothetical protein Aau02nite_55060 [Actinoplanes auranticolor]
MGVMDVTTTAQPLDRRRDKAGTASAAATAAEAAVTDIDRQLETLTSLAEQQQQALRRATEEAKRLKRSLKAAEQRRAELAKDRRRAVAKAGRARAKADLAEARYDKEVLAELVRREKEKDRSASRPAAGKELEPAPERAPAVPSSRPVETRTTDSKAADGAAPARSSRRSPVADPPPEKPDEATQTARRTAARKTAKAARLIR